MTIYFIADLHLQETDLTSTNLFLDFLAKHSQYAEAIYILGDFFEFWVGDDYTTSFIQSIKNALITLTNKNVSVFFMRGNRDFLIGSKFFAETGCIPIVDPYVINLGANKVVLTHGDLLTVNDKSHQQFRAFVSHPLTKLLFLSLPKKIRIMIARYLRKNSIDSYQKKVQQDPHIFAVVQEVVNNYLIQHAANIIVHGHTHCPELHTFTIHDNTYKRMVLGAWGEQAKILTYDNGNFNLQLI